MHLRAVRWGWWLIYAVWTVMAALLLSGLWNKPQGSLRAPEELLGGVKLPGEESWMGIYLKAAKIGYVHSVLTQLGGGYEIREESVMSAALMGVQQEMKVNLTVLTDSTLALKAFDGSIESGAYPTRFSGHLEGRVLSVEVTAGGTTNERFLPAPEPLYVSQAIKPLIQAGRLGEGDSLKLSGFDPVAMEMQELVVTGAALKQVQLLGEDRVARVLKTRMGEYESQMWVDEEGNSLLELGPMGLLMRREPPEKAMAGLEGAPQVDFAGEFSIVPTGDIPAPRKTQLVRMRVTGIALESLQAASDRQRIVDLADSVVEVSIAPLHPHELDWDGSAHRWLKDAPFIESRSPLIREAAEKAVSEGTDRLDSLEKLSDWVFQTVEKKPSAGIPSALAVLQAKVGDCNEHTALFTAMARSLDIPCRMELGVVYQQGQFYYHAWPAVWVDARRGWVEFEPTFGLKRADAARLAFAAGDLSDAARLAGVIGKVEIAILQVNE